MATIFWGFVIDIRNRWELFRAAPELAQRSSPSALAACHYLKLPNDVDVPMMLVVGRTCAS